MDTTDYEYNGHATDTRAYEHSSYEPHHHDHHYDDDMLFETPKGFIYLGYDIMWLIASYCADVQTIARLGMTCTTLQYQVLEEDEEVWRPAVLARHFMSDMAIAKHNSLKETNPNLMSWRSIAKQAATERHYRLMTDLLRVAVQTPTTALPANLGFNNSPAGEDAKQYLPAWEGGRLGFPNGTGGLSAVIDVKALGAVSSFDLTGGMCVGKSAAWVVASALRHAPSLDTLRLPGQNLGTHGAQLLAIASCGSGTASQAYGKLLDETLKTAPSPDVRKLEQLCFANRSTGVGSVGSVGGGKSLITGGRLPITGFGRALTTLVLNENRIEGEAGGIAIATIIANAPNLVTLSLRKNQINAKGAVAIANAIASSASGSEGAPTTSPHHAHLCRLFIDENPIGPEGANAIADAFATNTAARVKQLRDAVRAVLLTQQSTSAGGGATMAKVKVVRRAQFVLTMESCGFAGLPTGIGASREALMELVSLIREVDRHLEKTASPSGGEGGGSKYLPSFSVAVGNGAMASATKARNAVTMGEKEVVQGWHSGSTAASDGLRCIVDVTNLDVCAEHQTQKGGKSGASGEKGCVCM